jgi:hypothetical protein
VAHSSVTNCGLSIASAYLLIFSLSVCVRAFQLRLISYSSADSFIKRDYVLDVIDRSSKFADLCLADVSSSNFIHITSADSIKAIYAMSKDKKQCLVQHRREYYNDFEDCLRDYRNQKIKSIQKVTKYHHSDGDNGESDSEYVDCTDAGTGAEFKHQSVLASKSMPHVPTEAYHDNLCRVPESMKLAAMEAIAAERQSVKKTICRTAATATIARQSQTALQMTEAQLKAHSKNNYNNQNVINKREEQQPREGGKVSAKTECPSTSAALINERELKNDKIPAAINVQRSPQLIDAEVRVATNSPAAASVAKKDELAKRKSCKKKQGSIKDPSQR